MLSLMNRARADLLAGHGREVCALLTRHGRDQVLGFRVDYDEDGSIAADDPRLPQSCEAMVRRQYADAQDPDVDVSWPEDLRRARFFIRSLAANKARVELKVQKPYGETVSFSLIKTGNSWRIDDSDGVPVGH